MRNKKGQFVKGATPEFTGGMLGKQHSKETKQKMSENNGRYWLGRKMTQEHIEKLRLAHIGRPSPNKGKTISEQTRLKMSLATRGRKFSKEHKRKISEAQKGKNGNNWQGGITPENFRIRNGIEIRLWKEAVFIKDNWTCQKCGKKSKKGERVILHSHHIRNFAQCPELRTSIENGITLCKKCHREFHKKYGKKNNTKEQINEFIKNDN